MAENLTPQQREAVFNRGGKLLVSAAAGSGKTKVLVDRLMSYLMDEQNPANLDEFLIITYTKAAASELRGKIASKLSEKIAQDPSNRHLQRQLQRLYLTKISTVHAFCADLLREYAYKLDLPADFRVADENECMEIRDRVMADVLDDAYERIGEDDHIRSFVDTQGLGRSDALVPEIITKVYDSARCHLSPEGWLDECLSNMTVDNVTDASQTRWGRFLMDDLFTALDDQISAMEICTERCIAADGMEKAAANLTDTLIQLKALRQSETWDQILQRKEIDYGRLTFSKKSSDPSLVEQTKAIRNHCKESLKKRLRNFSDPSAVVLRDLSHARDSAFGIVDLVRAFSDRYDSIKRKRRILDFGDLEHRTLDLLLGKNRSMPTAAAQEISRRFREIMVDEYQDSNAVQDAIFSSLTEKRNNLFMVGDVKQSIYQFRLADPGIFLEKYETYLPAEKATAGEGRKVMLSKNFRSSGGVLKGVNDVFYKCMSQRVGGLIYGEDEALNEGIPHVSLGEPEVSLHTIQVQQDTYAEEANFVADQIQELINNPTHQVRDGENLRRIKAEDIVILLRSPGSVGHHFQNALLERGIRCSTGGGCDLLQTKEISLIRSLLQTINNPRQDIPLLSVLLSPAFGFSANDIAKIRINCRKGSLYQALQQDDSVKTQSFLATLQQLRRDSKLLPLPQLLEKIYALTKLDHIFAAMEGGDARTDNLRTFYQLISGFESGGRKDLAQFLDHLQAMEEKGLLKTTDPEPGAVTIMSIHKSKGLEFPVVFLCCLSREFNRESTRAQVLCDKELGIGLSCVDSVKRVRYPTISKRAIAAKITADSLSEELRVLYVALTRPRDRLIMTYASKYLEKDLADIALRSGVGNRELMTAEVVCPGEWVLLTAMGRTEAGALHAVGGRPAETVLGDPVWNITVQNGYGEEASQEQTIWRREAVPDDIMPILKEGIGYVYPHEAASRTPSKLTATQQKGRVKDHEAAENAKEIITVSRKWRTPDFEGEKTDPFAYGNTIHKVMQIIPIRKGMDIQSISEELDRMCDNGILTVRERKMISLRRIAQFFKSEIGMKLCEAKELLREFKFSLLMDASLLEQSLSDEQVLLQGVVDCAMVEEDGITIIDYKTDHIDPDQLQQKVEIYRNQVTVYAAAMEKIYELPVKATYLYFFHLGKFVKI